MPFKNILHFSQPPSPLFWLCAILQDATPTKQAASRTLTPDLQLVLVMLFVGSAR